ncbi:hypothetical protein KC571_01715 [candidate division WWE3 bacterium]|uniref:Transmembrane protein n=1 Tax=candidate division WWE3 bacterium TaxID=2053526 RepID=A0A955LGD2_UNCKA|nr:hypothetical protein [candidate division WWE3 bacterium]
MKQIAKTLFLSLLVFGFAAGLNLLSPTIIEAQQCISSSVCPGPNWNTTAPNACVAPCGGGTNCCVPAASTPPALDCSNVNPLFYPECTFFVIGQLVVGLVGGLILIGALLLLYSFVHASFLYLTGGDDKNKTQKARATIGWSIVGLIGLTTVFAIFRFIVAAVPGLDRFIIFG